MSDSRESKGDFSDVVGSWTRGAKFENVSWIIHIGDDIDETNKLAISSLAPRRGPNQISYYFALLWI